MSVERFDQTAVCVATHEPRALDRAQEVDGLCGHGARCDVTAEDDQVGFFAMDLGQDCFQRRQVAVNVRQRGHPHAISLGRTLPGASVHARAAVDEHAHQAQSSEDDEKHQAEEQ
jgi:hypothetical protein